MQTNEWCWNTIISLSVISVVFPCRFLKCSFHFCSLYSWILLFSFVLEVFLLLLSSLTVCYANCHCLSSTKFFIFVIRSVLDGFQRLSNAFSYSYRITIAYTFFGKWRPIITHSLVCYLFVHRLRRIFVETILRSEDTPTHCLVMF